MESRVDIVVIGGGAVGAAIAMALSRVKASDILLLEAMPIFADGITSRNSGVIHSGIYYPPHSLKASLCVRGSQLLYQWCKARKVPHSKTGKLVVAKTQAECDELEKIYHNARSCEASGVSVIGKQQISEKEPHIEALRALYCSESGIVDPTELTHSFLREAESHGVMALTQCEVKGIEKLSSSGFELHTTRGNILTNVVINSTGLFADKIAKMSGIDKYKVFPCRGDYFRFHSKKTYRHLLYPVKVPNSPGLGVHLTIDLDGQYRLGPDVQYVADKNDLRPAEDKLSQFHEKAQKLLGPLELSQLSYDSCGIRPKLRGPNDPIEKDFVISEDLPGFINLVGIESPGLTACLAIAEHVAKMVE